MTAPISNCISSVDKTLTVSLSSDCTKPINVRMNAVGWILSIVSCDNSAEVTKRNSSSSKLGINIGSLNNESIILNASPTN